MIIQHEPHFQNLLQKLEQEAKKMQYESTIKKITIEIPIIEQKTPLYLLYLQEVKHRTKWKHYQLIIDMQTMDMFIFDSIIERIAKKAVFLTQIRLNKVDLNDFCMQAIKKADWKFVKYAKFNKNLITWRGAKELATCDWKYLNSLSLHGNRIKNKGVESICKGEWPRLKYLVLSACEIDDSSMRVLCKGIINNITFLDVSKNYITNQCFKLLCTANIKNLRQLNIEASEEKLTASLSAYFFKLPRFSELKVSLSGENSLIFAFISKIRKSSPTPMIDFDDQ